MEEFFIEYVHECEHDYAHEHYQNSVQQEIEKLYVVIRYVAPTRNSMLLLCLPRTEFMALHNVQNFLDQPQEHLEEIKYLREKVMVIKYPFCPLVMWSFYEEQNLHEYVQSVPGILPPRGVNSLPFPHTATPWVRGMTLNEFITLAKQQNRRIQPAFVWHVAVFLLELVIGLRNGHPAQNGERLPVAHNNLHPRNILLGTESSYVPFPNLYVVDFGRGKMGPAIGPWNHAAQQERRDFSELLRQDLQQIGLVLHALAHGQHLAHCEDRTWGWTSHIVQGVCCCQELRVPSPSDFNRNDTDFTSLLKQLLGPQAYITTETALGELLEMARQRREDAVQSSVGDPQNRAFDTTKWDYGSSMVSDEDIVYTVHKWVWDLAGAGII